MMILDDVAKLLRRHTIKYPRIERIAVNAYFCGVLLEDGNAGLAMNVRGGTGYTDQDIQPKLFRMVGERSLEAVAELGATNNYVLSAVRLATLNAICQPLLDKAYLEAFGYHVEVNSTQDIQTMVKHTDVALVVGFGGLVKPLAERAKQVYVTELEPDRFRSTIIDENGMRQGPSHVKIIDAAEATPYLREANVVFITGSSLVTNTAEKLLQEASGAQIIVYGLSGAIHPDPLFARGVSIQATRRVTNGPLAMDLIENWSWTAERFFSRVSEKIVVTRPA